MVSSSDKTIAKNTIFLSLRMVFVLFVSLYTSRVFLRVLGVEDFGINNVVCGFVALFSFINTSMANGIQRFYNYEGEKNGVSGRVCVFNTALLIQGILALIIFLLLETVGIWCVSHKMVIPPERLHAALWVYHFSVASAIIVIFQAPFTAMVMAYEKMNYFALVGVVDVLLKLILAYILVYSPIDKLIFYGFVLLLISILVFLMYFVYCCRNFDAVKVERCFSWSILKKMLRFSGWGLLGTFACVTREQGLNIVLNLFFGPIVNAARGIAYQVSSALQGFVTSISVASKPQMVSSYANGDSQRTIGLMFSMSKLSFGVLLLMAIPICVEIGFVLRVWLGDVVPEHSSSFVILIILTNFINNLNAPLSNVVYATGKMKEYEIVFSMINLLIIPISIITLKSGLAPESVFIVYFIMTIFVQIGCLWALNKIISINIREYIVQLIVPLLLCSILCFPLPFLLSRVMEAGWLRFITVTIVSALTSSVLFYRIVLNSTERKLVVKFIKNRLP